MHTAKKINQKQHRDRNTMTNFFAPQQLGVSISGRVEAAAHSAGRFIKMMPEKYFVAELDFTNAFNTIHRDSMLKAIFDNYLTDI